YRGWRLKSLAVEPDVFHAPAIIGAVDHHRDVLDLRLPAGGLARVIDDRAYPFLDHPALDIPHDPLALFRIGFNRLLVDQRLDLGVAIAGVVARRFTDIALVEDLVGLVDRAACQADRQREVFSDPLGGPVGGLDGFRLSLGTGPVQRVDRARTRVASSGRARP